MNQISRCKNCGAPLDGAPGDLIVRCAYCGANNTFAPEQPLPPAWQPYAVAKPPRVSPTVIVVLASSFVVLLALGVVGGFLALRPSSPASTTFSVSPLAPIAPEWYTPTCLVDANGDEALDIAGLSARPGSERWTLGVVDGNTGGFLWSENSYVPVTGITCLSPGFFGMQQVGFALELFPAKTLGAPLSLALGDRVDKLGLGSQCLSIKTADGAEKSFSLTGNPVNDCPAVTLDEPWGDWGIKTQHTADGLDQIRGSETYSLTHRSPGTPLLSLTARAGNRTRWTTNLTVMKPNAGLAFAATPRMLVVYGVDTQANDVGVIVGVDPETGAQRYALQQDSHSSGNFRSFHYNGRFVLIDWGFGLHAYDPADGHRAWHIGGR